MNQSKWESLSPDSQVIINEMSDEYAEKLSRLWDTKDQNTINKWTKKNHVSIYLSEQEEKRWEKAVLPIYEAFVKEKSARGLAAIEALEFCKEWVRKNISLE